MYILRLLNIEANISLVNSFANTVFLKERVQPAIQMHLSPLYRCFSNSAEMERASTNTTLCILS